jgi:hypothetical protein
MRDVSSEEESRIVYPLVTGSNPVRLARLRFQPAALQQTATSRVVRDSHSEEFGLPPARIACAMRDGFDDGRRVFGQPTLLFATLSIFDLRATASRTRIKPGSFAERIVNV